MNYSELTDFELSHAVAKKWLPKKQHKFLYFRTCRHEGDYVEYLCSKYDPINNPSDAWPIILENEISLTCSICGSFWEAERHFIYKDKNPLRAAMIVYLMMGDE